MFLRLWLAEYVAFVFGAAAPGSPGILAPQPVQELRCGIGVRPGRLRGDRFPSVQSDRGRNCWPR